MHRKSLISLFISLVVGLTTIGSVAAQTPQPAAPVAAAALAGPSGTPVGTALAYQGQLKQNGNPANGNFDFQFILYDAASGGSQQGATLQLSNIAVSNGLFNVQLDFGQAVFNGDARFLEVGVKSAGSTETYTVLNPRTMLSAVPYALGMPGVTARNGIVTVGGQLYMTGEDFSMLPTARGDGGRALVHDTGDRLIVNWGNDFAGGTVIGSGLQINGGMDVNGDIHLNGNDFTMGPNDRGDGGRAMVHWENDTLVLNFGQDFSGGTAVEGSLSIGGRTRTNVLEITGGSDLAELFSQADNALVEPGTIMVIDPDHAGKLKISTSAYDRKVAGIVSGAGDIKPGLTLQQEGVLDGNLHVAMAGRVYVKAEAKSGSIEPGDLLTTSGMAGYAMKASNDELSHGAVIGKAMTSLRGGTGLVLVLVNLQ